MNRRISGKPPSGLGLFVALFITASLAPAQTLRGLRYEDPTKGFKFRIPRTFEQVPVKEEERWTVAMFQTTREYAGSVTDGDSGRPQKPVIKVILFDEKAVEREKAIELESGLRIAIGRPYRDYRDYVDANMFAGYYFESEEEDMVGDIPVTKYEVKVEKGARDRMRYIGWVFHGDGYDFAVQVDLLEAQYAKLKDSMFACFRTFEFIPREVEEDAGAADENETERKPWDKMTVEERRDWRMAEEDKREERLRDRLPEDWTVTKTDELLVLSHASKSYTNRIIRMAEACREYMEERFGSLSDEYVRRAVIRICKDWNEYVAYRSGGSADFFIVYLLGEGEIIDYSESAPSLELILDGVAWQYLSDKHGGYFDIPYWLRQALTGYFKFAQMRGRKVVFERTAAENTMFARLDRNNPEEIKTPRELMQITAKDVRATYEEDRQADLHWQCLTLLRFLEGPAKRHRLLRGRDFLLEYMKQVTVTAEKLEKKNSFTVTRVKLAETVEEEEQQARERAARAQQRRREAEEREKELLVEVAGLVSPWSLDEWENLNDLYRRFSRQR